MENDVTVSVSKGVFIFANGFKRNKKIKQKSSCLFNSISTKEPWYVHFKRNWGLLENEIKQLHHKTYSLLLNDVVSYINSFQHNDQSFTPNGVIPTATLLTGVNQPDHVSQITTLIDLTRDNITPHVAIINSYDGSSIKLMVENMIWQLINGQNILSDNSEDECLDDSNTIIRPRLKKSQCTMKILQKWYHNKYQANLSSNIRFSNTRRLLVIIIPDFESFNCNILQDFVMIISSHISTLPFVLVFGVATSVSALHKSFPYNVSSKLLIKVFHSHSSPVFMNQVLENIFLTPTSPFHLSGKAYELLTDVFLFYDFSVAGLLQSIKYCMMDHYFGNNLKSLCCERDKIDKVILELSSEDLENVRQLMSFRGYLEKQNCRIKIMLFEDDVFLREVLCKEMYKLRDYLFSFHICVRLLYIFVKDLPKNILGKSVREIYSKCATENISVTTGFRECMQLINFQSQLRLIDNVKDALKTVNHALQISSPVKPLRTTPLKNNSNNVKMFDSDFGVAFIKSVRVHMMMFLRQLENANNEVTLLTHSNDDKEINTKFPGNRYKLKEKLLQATRVDRVQSEFEMIRSRFVSYLEEVFSKGLLPPHTQTFHEIMFFSDVTNIKKQIVGSPRGALHTALNNPFHYLQCHCCRLPSLDSAVDSLPDVCLVYKLHRECGKHINLYDWLQAFAAVINPTEEEDQRQQDSSIQTRFTRAVAELQFLGFIKTSKRKTDHVMRLTW
ncbi:origin recognition complex subunit 3 [Battus philenor]|uniref:origin recognition complex subunit 3 n=1 Tax=Battus philenor TaxID=42288 RepID=UPI0035CF39B6